MPHSFEIDNKKSTILGFWDAGWKTLQEDFVKKGIQIFTTSDYLIPVEKSIYWRHHPKETLERKAHLKKKEPESVHKALQQIGELFMSLTEMQTRENFLRYFVKDIMRCDDELMKYISQLKQGDLDPNEKLLNLLVSITTNDTPEVAHTKNGEVDLTGYRVASALRSNSKALKNCLHGADSRFFNELKTWCDHANLDATAFDTQYVLAQSKSAVVDTLQVNLDLLMQGKPLIPINFIISSDSVAKYGEGFVPNWEKAIKKSGSYFTLAEVRMIYKLMEEIGDPLISDLMKSTVFFKHRTEEGFVTIKAPWQEFDAKNDWMQRVRTDKKIPYKDRIESNLPAWIQELRTLSKEVSTFISKENVNTDFKKRLPQQVEPTVEPKTSIVPK